MAEILESLLDKFLDFSTWDVRSAGREISVGEVLTSWNPLSHNEYWADGDFI
jgi:hypothetical protein